MYILVHAPEFTLQHFINNSSDAHAQVHAQAHGQNKDDNEAVFI